MKSVLTFPNFFYNNMEIKLANEKDCFQIAQIHFKEIKHGFLNQLGKRFLGYFYLAMIDSPNAFLIIAKENNSVIGFVSGCTNLKKFYKEFIRKYIFKSFFIFLKKMFNPNIFKKVLETIKYSQKKEKDLPRSELLSIAVIRNFQGQDVARKLLEKFVSEMNKKDINEFKVIVGENLIQANKFYQKNGFEFHSKDAVHKDTPSNIYIYKIV